MTASLFVPRRMPKTYSEAVQWDLTALSSDCSWNFDEVSSSTGRMFHLVGSSPLHRCC